MKKLLLTTVAAAAISAGAGPLVLCAVVAAPVEDEAARVQAIESENNLLRRENAALRERARLQAENAALRKRVSHSQASSSQPTSAELPVEPTAPVRPDPVSSNSTAPSLPPSATADYAAYVPVAAPVRSAADTAGSWTGFYVGGELGARATQTDVSTRAASFNGVSGDPFGRSLGVLATSDPLDATAFRFGAYAGYNWQVAPQWVVGVEGDVGWADRAQTLGGFMYPGIGLGFKDDFLTVTPTWDASVRGRFGFLLNPSTLLYAAGGGAWMHLETQSNCGIHIMCFAGAWTPGSIGHEETRSGWTVGGGLETALGGNWLARAEYRYADFGSAQFTDKRSLASGAVPVLDTYELRMRTHLAMFGLGYKFGADPGATMGGGAIYKAPPMPVAWDGLYVGADVGARFTRTDVTSPSDVVGGAVIDLSPFATSQPFDGSAFRAGGFLGYNRQVAPRWVVGLESDFGWADHTTTLGGLLAPGIGQGAFAAESFSVKTTWDASVRARAGVLVRPGTLAYVTAGVAWQQFETTSTCGPNAGGNTDCPDGAATPNTPHTISHDATRVGWTAGGGIETRLWGNWTARGQYRYADFGTASFTDSRTFPGAGNIPFLTPIVNTYDVHLRTHTATFGLAYRFGDMIWGR